MPSAQDHLRSADANDRLGTTSHAIDRSPSRPSRHEPSSEGLEDRSARRRTSDSGPGRARALPRSAALAAGLLALLSASCITTEFNRNRELLPIQRTAMEPLEVGSATLAECLATFGAPLRVWEIDTGAALAWYWIDKSDWGITFSVPAGDAVEASFSYGESNEDIEGLVLFFDADWTLTQKRWGRIAAIAPTLRRPADLDLTAGDELEVEAATSPE